MPTKNPRINITFDTATAGVLASLAKHEHKSISKLAKELILQALERHEDQVLSAIAKERDTGTRKRVKHTDAWK